MTWLWLLPSIIALLIKCFLFFHSDIRKQYFLIFLVATFFCLNLLELLIFFRLGYDLLLLKLYYCAATFSVFYLLLICSAISQSCQFIKSDLALVAISTLAATILFTDKIVLGFSPLPNGSITRIPGDYYIVFQLYVATTLLFAFVLLIRRLVRPNDYYLKAKCIIALLSFTPTIMVIFVIMGLMQLGYQVNMVGFLSLSTCFMFAMSIPLSNKHKLFNAMKFVPFSRERRYSLKMKRLLKQLEQPIRGNDVNMKGLLKEIEALVIENTHNYFDSQKEVAHILNTSESKISRKIYTQSKK